MPDLPDLKEAVERVTRYIDGETCRTIYKLPPNGRQEPLRADLRLILDTLSAAEARAEAAERRLSQAEDVMAELVRLGSHGTGYVIAAWIEAHEDARAFLQGDQT